MSRKLLLLFALMAHLPGSSTAGETPSPAVFRPQDQQALRLLNDRVARPVQLWSARMDCSDETCSRLTCEEACYKLQFCGQQIRDRDNDGIPCENVCSRPCN